MSAMKKFAAFDIDGTLIRWQLYHALVDDLIKRGDLDASIFEQVHQARANWKKRTHDKAFHDYEEELVRVFLSSLPNIKPENFEAACKETFEEYKDQVYTFTRELIKYLKSKDYLVFAVSASQSEIVGMMAAYYGFDDFVGAKLVKKNGKFTGKTVTTHGNKDQVLKDLVKKHNVRFEGSVAVGDSESDIRMLEIVEQPIAFNPTSGLFKTAKEKQWPIVVERKSVVYKLEPSGDDTHGRYTLA